MNTYAPPSRSGADDGTIVGMLRIVLGKFLQNVDDMLPARVVAYDRETNRAAVQPMIDMVTTSVPPERITRAQIASVPVLQLGGGGFVMSFPIVPGDFGWIKANDRDISLFKKTLAKASPNTQRKHSFEDALFIPDTFLNQVTIDPLDEESALWQSLDGSIRIALASTYIKMMGSVGIGAQPSAHAILDLQSTTKAFKPPRMTTAQRNALTAEEGMVIYNTSVHGLQCYNGSTWG